MNAPGTDDLRVSGAAELLAAIESELRRLRLWSAQPPAAAALASTVPFCYDTLQLTEWLQWVFLPRMQALLDSRAPLPAACAIAPLAEEEFPRLERDTARLLELIRSFDRLISATVH